MQRMRKYIIFSLTGFLSTAIPVMPQVPSQEAMAEKLFLSGQNLIRGKYYQQAIQDFTSLLNSYPNSSYADNALLELGKYYYFVERSPQEALKKFEEIIKSFQGRETTADAYYYKGLVLSEGAATEQQLQDGLANFMRTVQFYPSSPIVEDSLYQAGLVELRLQHYEQAAEYFERCTTEYPEGHLDATAQLALGRTDLFIGKTERAMIEIQRVRGLSGDHPESGVALRWLSLLWRLYYQTKLDPSGLYKNQILQTVKSAVPIEECSGLAFDPNQNLYFSDPKMTRIHVVGLDLKTIGGFSARKPGGISFDSDGAFYAADANGVLTKDIFTPLTWVKPGKRDEEPLMKVKEIVRSSADDFYILEGSDGRVLHFTSAMKFDSIFAPSTEVEMESIAIDTSDRLALLLKKEKKINIYDRRGKLLLTIPPQAAGYSFQSPIQVRFDTFGHLYVLDRDARGVVIFDRQGKLLIQSPPGIIRTPREFAVNDSGELYLWDDKSAGIWIIK